MPADDAALGLLASEPSASHAPPRGRRPPLSRRPPLHLLPAPSNPLSDPGTALTVGLLWALPRALLAAARRFRRRRSRRSRRPHKGTAPATAATANGDDLDPQQHLGGSQAAVDSQQESDDLADLAAALEALRASQTPRDAPLTGVRAVERLMRSGNASSREEAALVCSVLACKRLLQSAGGGSGAMGSGLGALGHEGASGGASEVFEAGSTLRYRATRKRSFAASKASAAGGSSSKRARGPAAPRGAPGGPAADSPSADFPAAPARRTRTIRGPPVAAYRALALGWASLATAATSRPLLGLALALGPALGVLARVEAAAARQRLMSAEAALLRRLVKSAGGAGGGPLGGGAPAVQALLEDMWPGWLSPFLSRLTSRQVGDALARRPPPKMLAELRLAKFRLGSAPPALVDVHVLHGRGPKDEKPDLPNLQHCTVVDIEMVADMPDLRVELSGREAKLGIPVKLVLSGACVRGRVRVRLEWLPWPPHMRLLGVQFLGPPQINFSVSGATDIPGVEAWLRGAIDRLVRSTLVAPNEVTWDAEAFWGRRRLPVMWASQRRPPEGVLASSTVAKRRESGYDAVDARGVSVDATAWLAVSLEAAEGLGGGQLDGDVRCRLAHAVGTARRTTCTTPAAEAHRGRCSWAVPSPATFEVVQWLEDACVEVEVYQSDVTPVRSVGSCIIHAAHFLKNAEMEVARAEKGQPPQRSRVLWIDLAPQGCGRLKVRVLMHAPSLAGLVTSAPGAGLGRLRPAEESTSGWLAKVHVKDDVRHGFGYMSAWKRRYFVLTPASSGGVGALKSPATVRQGLGGDDGGVLMYYRDSSCENKRGTEALTVASEVSVLTIADIRRSGAPAPPERFGTYAFGLAPPGRPMLSNGTLLMIAHSAAERDRWMAALTGASRSNVALQQSPLFMRARSSFEGEDGARAVGLGDPRAARPRSVRDKGRQLRDGSKRVRKLIAQDRE